MSGNIYLTTFNRQGEKKNKTYTNSDMIPKPRIKLIHNDGTVKLLPFSEETLDTKPSLCLNIEGKNYYITDKIWSVNGNFSEMLESLLSVETVEHFSTSNLAIGNTYSSSVCKWFGGALAKNGKIYGAPFSDPSILEIDPVTNTTKLINVASSMSGGYQGAVAFEDSVYFVPNNEGAVLKLNTVDSTLISFSGSSLVGSGKWVGGVLASNDKIYFIPASKGTVLEVNPLTNALKEFGDLGGTTTAKWRGGALAPNGKIYCVPSNSPAILIINTDTHSTVTFGDLGGTTSVKWRGGALAPNGKIYCAPYEHASILEIDPDTNTTQFIGSFSAPQYNQKFIGANVTGGGMISFSYARKSNFCFLNPETGVILSNGGSDVTAYYTSMSSGILAPNGFVYGIPAYDTRVVRVSGKPVLNKGVLSPYFNKF